MPRLAPPDSVTLSVAAGAGAGVGAGAGGVGLLPPPPPPPPQATSANSVAREASERTDAMVTAPSPRP
jgi:hypothetical protein